jgi:DNA-binding beta-propeller fold protein YncE
MHQVQRNYYPEHIVYLLYSPLGNVYIADQWNHRIRKVTVSTGIITTIAGTGSTTFSGDGGAATSATLYFPYGVALDSSGMKSTPNFAQSLNMLLR